MGHVNGHHIFVFDFQKMTFYLEVLNVLKRRIKTKRIFSAKKLEFRFLKQQPEFR